MLETTRLFIRPLKESDWQELKNIFVDFNRSAYAVYDRPLPTGEEGKALMKSWVGEKRCFAIFMKESGKMIGYVCFHREKNIYDLGYCFHSAYHQKVTLTKVYGRLSTALLLKMENAYLLPERQSITRRLADCWKSSVLFANPPKRFRLIKAFRFAEVTLF